MNDTAQIIGLAEFRRDLRRAQLGTKEVTAAMKAAGAPVLAKAASLAPKASGALAGSGRIMAGGTKGRVVFKAAYAAGAEFGSHGRWSGFEHWGQPPRFGYRALSEEADNVGRILTEAMVDVFTAYGWFEET